MRALTLNLGSLVMTSPDDLAVIHRRIVQVVAIVSLLAAIAAAGVWGGRLITTLDTMNATVARLATQMEAQTQAAANDRWELRSLRDRVDRLERAASPR